MPRDTNSEPGNAVKLSLWFANQQGFMNQFRLSPIFFMYYIYIFKQQQQKNEISMTAVLVFLMSAAYLCWLLPHYTLKLAEHSADFLNILNVFRSTDITRYFPYFGRNHFIIRIGYIFCKQVWKYKQQVMLAAIQTFCSQSFVPRTEAKYNVQHK